MFVTITVPVIVVLFIIWTEALRRAEFHPINKMLLAFAGGFLIGYGVPTIVHYLMSNA